jgi:hypothetical protein
MVSGMKIFSSKAAAAFKETLIQETVCMFITGLRLTRNKFLMFSNLTENVITVYSRNEFEI